LQSGKPVYMQCSNYFEGLLDAIVTLFADGEAPVQPQETLAVMALIDAGRLALERRDKWIEVAELL
jgi:hypothetical protein